MASSGLRGTHDSAAVTPQPAKLDLKDQVCDSAAVTHSSRRPATIRGTVCDGRLASQALHARAAHVAGKHLTVDHRLTDTVWTRVAGRCCPA
jgi:hypothetical protein